MVWKWSLLGQRTILWGLGALVHTECHLPSSALGEGLDCLFPAPWRPGCALPPALKPPSAWPGNVVSWEVAAPCTFGRWLEESCWTSPIQVLTMYWHGGYNPLELSCPLWIGALVLGPWIFTLYWSCQVCSHPSLKIPEEASMLNYTTDASAVISEVFFFSIDFPTRGGKILILSPTTTLLWIKFFNFANYDERWHFREFDPEKIQNWPISADEFLITHPEWLWHIGCVTMVVMGHTARLAECLRNPRESSSEKADKIRKCLRQVLQGQVKKRKE